MTIPIDGLTDIIYANIELFILFFVRMMGIFLISPIFGRRNVPASLKAGFSFLVALIMFTSMNIQDYVPAAGLYDLVLRIGGEIFIGGLIGFVAYTIFTGIYLAGQLMDMQMGFGMVQVLDPIQNIQVPVSANLYYIVSMLLYLASNGHHYLIRALRDSFNMVPPGKLFLGNELPNDLVRLFTEMYMIGFKIAGPVLMAILIIDVVLGIMARTIPQINVFILGMPLKIVVGLVIMIITVSVFASFTNLMNETVVYEITSFLKNLINNTP